MHLPFRKNTLRSAERLYLTGLSGDSVIGRRRSKNHPHVQQDRILMTTTHEGHPVLGVFDGHGDPDHGSQSAEGARSAVKIAANEFICRTQPRKIAKAIENALYIESIAQRSKELLGGSTATLASLTSQGELLITQLGDSAAVYFPDYGEAVELHELHNIENPSERSRVEQHPSFIGFNDPYFRTRNTFSSSPKYNELAVSRSVGDYLFPFVESRAETSRPNIAALGRGVLIIATDGLWGSNMHNIGAVENVIKKYTEGEPSDRPLAQELTELGQNTVRDNVSVVAARLDTYSPNGPYSRRIVNHANIEIASNHDT